MTLPRYPEFSKTNDENRLGAKHSLNVSLYQSSSSRHQQISRYKPTIQRSVSNVTMPYGGVRRRPGPLLGGSAILAKRNNQQRIQYLQQLQTIVNPNEERSGSYKKLPVSKNNDTNVADVKKNEGVYETNIKIKELPNKITEFTHCFFKIK